MISGRNYEGIQNALLLLIGLLDGTPSVCAIKESEMHSLSVRPLETHLTEVFPERQVVPPSRKTVASTAEKKSTSENEDQETKEPEIRAWHRYK